jgi:transcriptional regulator with XRE-family HTH domain
MSVTGAQVKAARMLLGWSQPKLAAETGVTAATIAKFEEHQQRPPMLEVSVVRRMLDDAGIEFIAENGGGSGVRLRKTTNDNYG